MVDPWVAVLTGLTVGGYRIDSYIGGGAFGRVFEVTEVSTNAKFAMKILVPGPAQAATEFDTEGELLRKLISCSGVINWIESGSEVISMNAAGSSVAVPMQFGYHVMALATASLQELVIDPVRLAAVPWPERVSHWRGVIKGVHQMHLNSVVHRDLKSANCLLMLSGGNVEVQIADLGRSKDIGLPASLAPIAYAYGRGDPRFAPPEHLWVQGGFGTADFRNADLYGLGSILVELATGHPMTALAIGSLSDLKAARDQGEQNHRKGVQIDLGNFRPKFHQAVDRIGLDLPPTIRHDAVNLLKQLCDPVPTQRPPRRIRDKRYVPDPGLLWLLRQADILSSRLSISPRPNHKSSKQNAMSRSA